MLHLSTLTSHTPVKINFTHTCQHTVLHLSTLTSHTPVCTQCYTCPCSLHTQLSAFTNTPVGTQYYICQNTLHTHLTALSDTPVSTHFTHTWQQTIVHLSTLTLHTPRITESCMVCFSIFTSHTPGSTQCMVSQLSAFTNTPVSTQHYTCPHSFHTHLAAHSGTLVNTHFTHTYQHTILTCQHSPHTPVY